MCLFLSRPKHQWPIYWGQWAKIWHWNQKWHIWDNKRLRCDFVVVFLTWMAAVKGNEVVLQGEWPLSRQQAWCRTRFQNLVKLRLLETCQESTSSLFTYSMYAQPEYRVVQIDAPATSSTTDAAVTQLLMCLVEGETGQARLTGVRRGILWLSPQPLLRACTAAPPHSGPGSKFL